MSLYKIAHVTKDGEIIQVYPSLKHAAIAFNITAHKVTAACRSKYPRGEFTLRHLDENGEIIVPIKEYLNHWGLNKRLNQYDSEDNFIATYESICDASRATSFARKNIVNVASGKQKSTHGFIFKFLNPDGLPITPEYKFKPRDVSKGGSKIPSKPIRKYDENGLLVKEFKSKYMATKEFGDKKQLGRALKSGNIYKGFIYKYAV